MTRTVIAGLGTYAPARVLTNHELERMVDTSDEWITTRTGILAAARGALLDAGIDATDLDLILVATATPDMLFPATACLVQHGLGATGAAAFDLSAACSGFIYGLSVADGFIRSGTYRTILGSMAAPFTAWQLTRSLETVSVRIKAGDNTQVVRNLVAGQ